MKSIGFFDEIMQKNIVQNMSWKNDENIFHQKCTKQHCLVTESVSILCLWRDHIDPCEKNQVFSCLSITIGIPIVNACTTSSLYRNACLLWGRGAGSRHNLVSRILWLFLCPMTLSLSTFQELSNVFTTILWFCNMFVRHNF